MNIISTNHTTQQPEIGDFEDYYFDFEEKKKLRIVQKDLGLYNKKTGKDVYAWKIQNFFTWFFRGLFTDQNIDLLAGDNGLPNRSIWLTTQFNDTQFDFNKQQSNAYLYKTYPLMRYQDGLMITNNRMNGQNVEFAPLQHQLLFIFVKGVKGMIDENGKHTEIVGIAKFDQTHQHYQLIQSNIFETDQDSEIEIYLKFKKYIPNRAQDGTCNGTYTEIFEFYSPEEEYYRYYRQQHHNWQGPPIYKSQITLHKFLLRSDDSDDDD